MHGVNDSSQDQLVIGASYCLCFVVKISGRPLRSYVSVSPGEISMNGYDYSAFIARDMIFGLITLWRA